MGGREQRVTLGQLFRFWAPMAGTWLMMPAEARTTAGWVETYPVQVLEAMGHGVTVVTSDSGALPEVVGKAGMVFRDGHPEGLTEALARLLEDGALRERLAAEGRRRVIAEYVDDAIAR